MGYNATAQAYRDAVSDLSSDDLTMHYTDGADWFREEFLPRMKTTLEAISGGQWDLEDYVGFAAGSDVDFMTHIIEAVALERKVCLYPGDWYGFLVGSAMQEKIAFDTATEGAMACLCIPSVRNGHITAQMLEFLDRSEMNLLNINLFPTLESEERTRMASALGPVMEKSILSISFSRGFGLTASQLGVILIHRDHPLRRKMETQWNWFTYFYNRIAAEAFLRLDLTAIEKVDQGRRRLVNDWLVAKKLPVVDTGSYYVKSFCLKGPAAPELDPVLRGDLVRLCFKPDCS